MTDETTTTFTSLPQLNEFLLRVSKAYEIYEKSLWRIAREDYRGNEPEHVKIAKMALAAAGEWKQP